MLPDLVAYFVQDAGAEEKRLAHEKLHEWQGAGHAVQAIIGKCHRNGANDNRRACRDNTQIIWPTAKSPNGTIEAETRKSTVAEAMVAIK